MTTAPSTNRPVRLEILRRAIHATSVVGSLDKKISSVTFDSREVEPGGLFVAIKGMDVDGNRFVEQSIGKGAVAIVSEQERDDSDVTNLRVTDDRAALAKAARCFFRYCDKELTLIGITGTNGKTTTAYLIHSILQHAGINAGLLSTIEYWDGRLRAPSVRTTPESVHLQALLHKMRSNACSHAVLEVTSHALALKRTHGLQFQSAIFTNLSHDHIDFHGTAESYLAAKCKLFESLVPAGTAIVNLDDPAAANILSVSKARHLTFGCRSKNADIYAEIKAADVTGTHWHLKFPEKGITVHSCMPGRFHGYNILAAATAGLSLGLSLACIKAGIEAVKNVPGRMQLISAGERGRIFVDFAHTPAALESALESSRAMCQGKLLLVFGCGGQRDQVKRAQMAAVAEVWADKCFITTDNPRSEDPEKIMADIDQGFRRKQKRFLISDRREAMAAAIHASGPDDVVLIAGRGHELHQEIQGTSTPFDDRVVCRQILQELSYAAL